MCAERARIIELSRVLDGAGGDIHRCRTCVCERVIFVFESHACAYTFCYVQPRYNIITDGLFRDTHLRRQYRT